MLLYGSIACIVLPLLIGADDAPTACSFCACTNGNLDCTSRRLTNHLNDTYLNGTNYNDVLFDQNDIVHLKPFPLMSAKKLSLRHNRITAIDVAAFRYVKNLTELDLSHNHLTSHELTPHIFMGVYSPETYEPLATLTILKLSGNALHTLHPDIFEHLPNLKELSLDSNPLKLLDRTTATAIATLLKLNVLDLSSTKISQLPPTLLHTPRYIETVNLSTNEFTSVPISLGEAGESLRILILDNNPIVEINSFPPLHNLEILHLNDLPKLQNIGSGAFKTLSNLKELSITRNVVLENIAEDAFTGTTKEESWPPLEKLYINNNKLGYFGQEFIPRWDHLTELDISSNPWICDCENQWFLSTLVPQFVTVNRNKAINLRCEKPIEMQGRLFVNLSNAAIDMRCLDSRGSRPEKDAFVLVAVLIGLLLAVPLSMATFALYQRAYSNTSPLLRFSYHKASFVDTIN